MRFRPFSDGDVVWGPDAYHADDPDLEAHGSRPWVVVSTETYPRQGHEYLVCAITSNLSPSPHLVPIADVDWERRGTMKPGQIDPTTVVCLKHDWIERYTGRLTIRPVSRARKLLRAYLTAP